MLNWPQMNPPSFECDLLIVGAGLCGLLTAAGCAGSGHIVVLDKGPGPGGRMASEEFGGALADIGAQFFTARHPDFVSLVEQWQAAGLAYCWSTGWSDGLVSAPPDGRPRYAVHGGMAALARYISAQAQSRGEIRAEFGVDLIRVCSTADGWLVESRDGGRFAARALALTTPPPVSLALLEAGEVALVESDRAVLAQLNYAPCLAGLFQITGAVHLPEPGAVQRPSASVTWMADNRRKGISPDAPLDATVITAHGGPEWSRAWFDVDDRDVLAYMEVELAPFLDPSAAVCRARLRRWRYAMPLKTHPELALVAAGLPPLYIGGDAFGGPRLEGAALSGLHIARLYTQGESG